MRHLIVLFPETYDLGPAPVEWRGSVGVGANYSTDGGLAIMSAWILRDEFCARSLADQIRYLRDTKPIPGRAAFDTGQKNSPRLEFIEDGFGATTHEIGHALGLPHDGRSPSNIMGQGFRRLRMNYPADPTVKARPIAFSAESSRLLGVSRYLVADVDRTDNILPNAEIRIDRGSGSAAAIVRIKATDDRSLRALVILDPDADTIVGGGELKGRSQTFDYTLPRGRSPSRGNPPRRLLILLADGGGNIARIETSVPSR